MAQEADRLRGFQMLQFLYKLITKESILQLLVLHGSFRQHTCVGYLATHIWRKASSPKTSDSSFKGAHAEGCETSTKMLGQHVRPLDLFCDKGDAPARLQQ